MFYKNSQNVEVQSVLFSYSGEPWADRADSSGGGGRARWQRLYQLILACGPRNPFAVLLKTRYQLHLSFPDIPLRDAPFFVNGDDVTVTIASADLVAHL